MKIRPIAATFLFALLILFATVPVLHVKSQGRPDQVAQVREDLQFVPGQLLVQFHPNYTPAEKARARGRVGAATREVIVREDSRPDQGGDLELVNLPPGLTVAAAVRELAFDPAVEFAEPNWIYHHFEISNDPYFTNGLLWGMYGDLSNPANRYGSQASEAWANGQVGSSTVYVGVVDEGIMYFHEDLSSNVWTNPYDPVDGVDNDGNGYVDDVHGWDFNQNDNTIYDGTSDDHGTHVSGTIAAVGGNGKGVAGICWKAQLISAKFLGPSGGTTANAIKAIDYITDLKNRDGLNIVATNNSWGGGGFSQALEDAIQRANSSGILFIAAAGNSSANIDQTPSYPASYPNSNIISVASITSSGGLSSFSNFGATSVDLGAPGSGIYSTVPGKRNRSSYASYSGTSMATPHVTGTVALYAAAHPGATAAQIKNAILSGTIATSSLAGKTVTGGRLDTNSALTH